MATFNKKPGDCNQLMQSLRQAVNVTATRFMDLLMKFPGKGCHQKSAFDSRLSLLIVRGSVSRKSLGHQWLDTCRFWMNRRDYWHYWLGWSKLTHLLSTTINSYSINLVREAKVLSYELSMDARLAYSFSFHMSRIVNSRIVIWL